MESQAVQPVNGIVIGRFQPVHLGHMEYLVAARSRCRRLTIGISNPNLNAIRPVTEDPNRSVASSNPFSYYERLCMLRAACEGAGWKDDDYVIVPAPVGEPDDLPQYLPRSADSVMYATIYDAWGEAKKRMFEALGYRVVVLWRRSMADRFTSGTMIRDDIRKGGTAWRDLVPAGVDTYILERQRIRPI